MCSHSTIQFITIESTVGCFAERGTMFVLYRSCCRGDNCRHVEWQTLGGAPYARVYLRLAWKAFSRVVGNIGILYRTAKVRAEMEMWSVEWGCRAHDIAFLI